MAGRVRVKTVKKTLGNVDVQSLFNSAVGGEDASVDVKIAWPKFKHVRRHTARMVALLDWLCKRPWLKTSFAAEAANIAQYTSTLSDEHTRFFVDGVPDLDAAALVDPMYRELYGSEEDHEVRDSFILGLEDTRPEDVEKFVSLYKRAVESDLVNTAVKICSNLITYRASIETREKLNGRFLLSPGLSFAPIPRLESANFKAFYTALPKEKRDEILVFLHKLYHISHDAYEAANLPDVDVEEFVSIIQQSIGHVKGQIPRCDEAFKKLEESIGLLRGNFGKYYKDSKHSGNPGMMMESFVMDVAGNSQNSSPKVRMQFKKIIGHYQKMAASQPKDKRTQALFNEIDANFEELQRRETEAGLETAEEEEGGGAESEAAAAGPAAVETVASMAAVAEGREMTAEERAAHKEEVAKLSKKRAASRRKAVQSMDKHISKHGSTGGLSDLAKELLAQLSSPPEEIEEIVIDKEPAAGAAPPSTGEPPVTSTEMTTEGAEVSPDE